MLVLKALTANRRPRIGLIIALSVWVVVDTQTPTATHRVLPVQPEPDALECLALTLYWESGGEPRAGVVGVGWVVLNRLAHPEFPSTVCQVVRQGGNQPGCQFSYSCDGQTDAPIDPEAWSRVRSIAQEVLTKQVPDPTGGALFFHSASLEEIPWTVTRQRTTQIGNQVYYQ